MFFHNAKERLSCYKIVTNIYLSYFFSPSFCPWLRRCSWPGEPVSGFGRGCPVKIQKRQPPDTGAASGYDGVIVDRLFAALLLGSGCAGGRFRGGLSLGSRFAAGSLCGSLLGFFRRLRGTNLLGFLPAEYLCRAGRQVEEQPLLVLVFEERVASGKVGDTLVDESIAAELGVVAAHEGRVFAGGGQNAVAVERLAGVEVEDEEQVVAHEGEHHSLTIGVCSNFFF